MLMDNSNSSGADFVAPTRSKKQGGKIAAVAILMLVLGGVMATAVFATINGGFDFSKNKSDNSSVSTNSVSSSAEEQDISDLRVLGELAYKNSVILSGGTETAIAPEIYTDNDDTRYNGAAFFNGLNDSDKVSSIIIATKGTINSDDYIDDEEAGKISDDDYAKVKEIDADKKWNTYYALVARADELRPYYEYIYGDIKEFPDETNNYSDSICPTTIYLKSLAAYFKGHGCGGMNFPYKIGAYRYKYTTQGNQANVYFAAGLRTYATVNPEETFAYFYDLEKSKTMSGTFYEWNWGPNSNSYQDFAHYKMVFEKDSNGNYIYKSVEKVED